MFNHETNEASLLRACLEGQTETFAAIVQKYQSLICAITYSATGSVDKSEELAQQAFIKAWNNLSQLKDLTKFRAWLCSIARHVVNDSFRRQKNDITSKAISMDSIQEHPSEDAGPVEAAISKEREAIVHEALSKIPDAFREPLVLYYREDRSYRQVADQLGFSEHTARDRISRAKSLLREKVASLVEDTIERTKPSKAFTTAVIASIAGLAIKGSGAAAAAGLGAATSATGTATGVASIMSGVTAKIITTIAVVAIGITAVVTYKHVNKPSQEPEFSQSIIVVQEKENEQKRITEKPYEQSSDNSAKLLTVDKSESGLETGGTVVKSPEPVLTKDAEFKFEPKGMLSGVITDIDTGEPVIDAKVTIGGSRANIAETDSNGFYYFEERQVIEAGNCRVGVTSKEYVGITDYDSMPIVNIQKGKQAVKHFQLEKACMINVLVLDHNNNPIEKARLFATSLADERKREVGERFREQMTDKYGYVLLGGLKPAQTPYLITATHRGYEQWVEEKARRYSTSKRDYAPGHLKVTLTDPNVTEYGEIVLEKGITVNGYADYKDGVPASGLKIGAIPLWWHANRYPQSYQIDANGNFTLEHIIPGSYKLEADIPEGTDMWRGLHIGQFKLPPDNNEPLFVQIPEKSPQALVSISGTVSFVGEETPSSVIIDAYSPQAGRGTTHLGYDYEIRQFQKDFSIDRLEPGTYRLNFSGSGIEDKTIESVQAPCEGLQVQLVCSAKPKLKGSVLNLQTGEPVRKFKVRARKLGTLRGANYVQPSQWIEFEHTDGKFELEAVGPGIYQVQVASEGFARSWSQEINTDENMPVAIELTAGGIIRGRVVNSKAEVINNAKVIPLSKAGGTMPRVLNEFVSQEGAVETVNGQFVLKNIAAGIETIKVVHPDYSFSIREGIEVVDGQTAADIEIVLSKGGTIEGYVYDGEGKAQSGVVLYVQDASGYGGSGDEEAGRLGMATTDAKGFYHVEGLPEKMCYVKRQNEWESTGVVRRALVPQNDKTIRLDFGGKPVVTGQVILGDRFLANHRIQLGAVDNPHFGTTKCYALTDIEGNFVFRGVPAGKHSIYYEHPNKRNEWVKIATFNVGNQDLDLGIVPEQMSRIRVNVINEQKDPNCVITRVYLQEGTEIWGQKMGDVVPPDQPDQPYVITNVMPGNHRLVLLRKDEVMICQEMEVADEKVDLELKVPSGTSAISGRFLSDSQQWVMMWREDKKLVAYLKPGKDETFKVKNLPTGHYLVGGNTMLDNAALLEFDLLYGQSKRIDIDTTEWSKMSLGWLLTQIVGPDGSPITGADVWLESHSGVVEPLYNSTQGQYFITEPGEYTLCASYPGYTKVTQQVFVRSHDLQINQAKLSPVVIRLEKD